MYRAEVLFLVKNILHYVVTKSDSGWLQASLLSLILSLDKIILILGLKNKF